MGGKQGGCLDSRGVGALNGMCVADEARGICDDGGSEVWRAERRVVRNAVKIKKKDSSTRSCRRKSGKKGELV